MTTHRRDPSRIPMRGAISLGVTAAGMAFLLSVRPPATTGTDLAFVSEASDGASDPAGSVGVAAATAAPTAGAPAPAEPAATLARQATITGDVVSTRFGDVQVQATVEGGAITNVVAIHLPDDDSHSLRISREVEGILAEEALAAQSADIDTISGATYTSRAYRQSLQSALDQLAA